MKKTRTFFLLFLTSVLLTFNQSAFCQKVRAVKGKKVLIQKQGPLQLQQGQSYEVHQGGKKRGKVKVLKLGKNQALAELIEGSAPGGAQLIDPSQRPSSLSDTSYALSLGINLFQPNDFTLSGHQLEGDRLGYDFDLQRSLNLRFQYRLNHEWDLYSQLSIINGKGTLENASLGPGSPSSADHSATQLDLGLILHLNHLFYLKGYLGYLSGEVTTLTDLVRQADYTGLALGSGVGIQKNIQQFFISAEFDLQYNYINDFSTGPTDFTASSASQIHLGFGFRGGIRF